MAAHIDRVVWSCTFMISKLFGSDSKSTPHMVMSGLASVCASPLGVVDAGKPSCGDVIMNTTTMGLISGSSTALV